MEGDEESLDNTCLFVGTSGDLMGNLVKRSRSPTENLERESEELELSLGLSMNGRFGVDPAMKKIRRSSSVSDIEFGGGSGAHAPLARTSSLPPERTGAEKLKNVGGGEGLHGGGGGCSDVKMGHGKFEKQFSSGAVGSRGLQSQFVEGATQTPTKVGAERGPTGLVDTLDMPFVSTRGSGPNNNKIEGFLYRYKKAEEVKIVCVCHGMFLSPAEFVKHGGGGDVAYPLKHIVVSPFPLY